MNLIIRSLKIVNQNIFVLKDCLQILFLILSKVRQINKFLFSLKSSESLRFSVDFRGIEVRRLKGLLSDLRKFLSMESPLKVIKNAFHFMLKALFVL